MAMPMERASKVADITKHKCIFCGKEGKLSKEHIWADWLRDHLERPGKQNYHWVNNSGEPKKGKLSRPGDAHAQTLKVVCATCNNGWMSRVQTEAKPYLVPLISDKWVALDTDAQAALTRWAAMFTMVVEFADPPTAVIPQEHRSALMLSAQVFTEWRIWIGRHNPENYHPAMFNHHGIKRPSTRQRSELFIQTTAFTVGRLYLQTCMVTPLSSGIKITDESFARAFDMRIIHPFRQNIITTPMTSHKQPDIQRISNSTVAGLVPTVMEVPLRANA